MSLDSLVIPIVIAELAVVLTFFFSIYNPLKKKQGILTDDRQLTRIKKYLLKNSLRDIKTFLVMMLLIFIVSFILMLVGLGIPSVKGNMYFWVLFLGLFYAVITGLLFSSYVSVHRNREAMCDSKDLNQFLRLFGLKKKYIPKMKDIILIAYKTNEKEKSLLAWILDSLDIKDVRIRD